MNLGYEDRYLIYVNLPLERIWQLSHASFHAGETLFEPDLITSLPAPVPVTRWRG
jgi:hypothetical protein